MRRAIGILTALLLMAAARPAKINKPAVIEHAKKLQVRELDPSLPEESLEHWLKDGPAHISQLDWSIDCDLAPYPEPPAGFPLCVRIRMQRAQVWGVTIFHFGTTKDGITGKPELGSGFVTTGRLARAGRFFGFDRLSDLPRRLSDASKADEAAGP